MTPDVLHVFIVKYSIEIYRVNIHPNVDSLYLKNIREKYSSKHESLHIRCIAVKYSIEIFPVNIPHNDSLYVNE